MNQSLDLPVIGLTPFFKQVADGIIAFWPSFVAGCEIFMNWIVVISIPLSVFFIIGIIYSVERLKVIREKEAEKHDLKVEAAYESVSGQGNRDLSITWKKVSDLL